MLKPALHISLISSHLEQQASPREVENSNSRHTKHTTYTSHHTTKTTPQRRSIVSFSCTCNASQISCTCNASLASLSTASSSRRLSSSSSLAFSLACSWGSWAPLLARSIHFFGKNELMQQQQQQQQQPPRRRRGERALGGALSQAVQLHLDRSAHRTDHTVTLGQKCRLQVMWYSVLKKGDENNMRCRSDTAITQSTCGMAMPHGLRTANKIGNRRHHITKKITP